VINKTSVPQRVSVCNMLLRGRHACLASPFSLYLCWCGRLDALYSFSVQGMRLARCWRRCELTATVSTLEGQSFELATRHSADGIEPVEGHLKAARDSPASPTGEAPRLCRGGSKSLTS
jgi:hypothetical protein